MRFSKTHWRRVSAPETVTLSPLTPPGSAGLTLMVVSEEVGSLRRK